MSLLLSVATSVLKSGWCVELLLETSTDECGLRGSGRVLRFSDSACNREMGVFELLVEIANIIRASLSPRERCAIKKLALNGNPDRLKERWSKLKCIYGNRSGQGSSGSLLGIEYGAVKVSGPKI